MFYPQTKFEIDPSNGIQVTWNWNLTLTTWIIECALLGWIGYSCAGTRIPSMTQHSYRCAVNSTYFFLLLFSLSQLPFRQGSSFWSQMRAVSFSITNIPMAWTAISKLSKSSTHGYKIHKIGRAHKTTIEEYCQKHLLLKGSKSWRANVMGTQASEKHFDLKICPLILGHCQTYHLTLSQPILFVSIVACESAFFWHFLKNVVWRPRVFKLGIYGI